MCFPPFLPPLPPPQIYALTRLRAIWRSPDEIKCVIITIAGVGVNVRETLRAVATSERSSLLCFILRRLDLLGKLGALSNRFIATLIRMIRPTIFQSAFCRGRGVVNSSTVSTKAKAESRSPQFFAPQHRSNQAYQWIADINLWRAQERKHRTIIRGLVHERRFRCSAVHLALAMTAVCRVERLLGGRSKEAATRILRIGYSKLSEPRIRSTVPSGPRVRS